MVLVKLRNDEICEFLDVGQDIRFSFIRMLFERFFADLFKNLVTLVEKHLNYYTHCAW